VTSCRRVTPTDTDVAARAEARWREPAQPRETRLSAGWLNDGLSETCNCGLVGVAGREIILAYPAHVIPVRSVRSTLLLAVRSTLQENGDYDAYCDAIPPAQRDLILQTVAGVWIPIEAAMVHYRALDSLLLSTEAQMRLGGATFERIRGTLLGTMLRFANDAGVTPWTLLPQLQRFWNRAFDGGGLQVVKVGPKEALGCCIQAEMSDSPYFRNALRGLLTAAVGLFCKKAYIQELSGMRERGSATFKVQWA